LFGFVNIIGYKIQQDISVGILEDLELNESKTIVNDVSNRYPSIFDGLALFIMVGVWVVGIAAGYMYDEHPMLFGFMILICIAALIAGMFLSNSFQDFMGDDEYSGMSATFPKTIWIISHLLEVGIMMMLSVIAAAIAKNKL
jgi:hypothetical protein